MAERQYFIDWIRALAFLLLIGFHCAMPFVVFGWEIKNSTQSLPLSRLIWWLHQWRLPLLFFISGAGIHYSLERRSVLSFAGERFRRLFIPLAFSMLFTIPFQVYFEWLQKGRITGSYAAFYPRVWDFIPYPEGALTWSHMWYVVYLFVFCLLLLPVFSLFKIRALKTFKRLLAEKIAHPIILPLFFLPIFGCYVLFYVKYPEQESLLDDWFLFVTSLIWLIYGWLFAGSRTVWEICEKYRSWYLSVALVCMGILYWRFWWNLDMPRKQDERLYLYGFLDSLHIWMLILAICGFAKKWLSHSNRFLQFATPAVYPFYILHQTIIVAAGYYVVKLNISIFPKMLLLAIITFGSLYLIYLFLIRPFILTRIVYGMKPRDKKVSSDDELQTRSTVPLSTDRL
jgi:hypothetical protein